MVSIKLCYNSNRNHINLTFINQYQNILNNVSAIEIASLTPSQHPVIIFSRAEDPINCLSSIVLAVMRLYFTFA